VCVCVCGCCAVYVVVYLVCVVYLCVSCVYLCMCVCVCAKMRSQPTKDVIADQTAAKKTLKLVPFTTNVTLTMDTTQGVSMGVLPKHPQTKAPVSCFLQPPTMMSELDKNAPSHTAPYSIPFWLLEEVNDHAEANVETASMKIQLFDTTWTLPYFTITVQVNKGDELCVYKSSKRIAAPTDQPAPTAKAKVAANGIGVKRGK